MTERPTGQDSLAARELLLDEVAAPGVDVAAARARVRALRAGRRRVRRGAAATAATVVAVLAVGWVLQDRPDPDEVVADRGDTPVSSTTTDLSTTSLVPAPASPVETSVVPPSTLPVAAPTTAAALPVAPPTTLAPNQTMRLELRAVAATVAAGDVAALEISWLDADHTGGTPAISVDWADPSVATLDVAAPSPRCDSPGAASGGVERRSFRYATPGPKEVRVTVRTCGGEGAYAESVSAIATLVVADPRLGAEPARTVVAVVPRAADGSVPPESLDDAVATVRSADPLVAPVVIAPRSPALAQYGTSGPATVLVLPMSAAGTLELTWDGSGCAASGELTTAAAASVSTVVLARSC